MECGSLLPPSTRPREEAAQPGPGSGPWRCRAKSGSKLPHSKTRSRTRKLYADSAAFSPGMDRRAVEAMGQ